VSELNDRQLKAIMKFAGMFTEYELTFEGGRRERVAKRSFVTGNVHSGIFHFHINSRSMFFKTMAYEQIGVEEMKVVKHEFQLDDSYKVTFRPTALLYPPREDQPEIIAKVLSPGANKIVTAQPGFGKTLVTMHCMNQMQLRTAAFMKSSYLDRWEPDLETMFDIKKRELLIIRGGQSLRNLMEMAMDGDSIGAINIISINTFSQYLTDWEKEGKDCKYPIAPIDFFKKCKIGFGVLDEAHQNPHQVMRMFSFMDIYKFLSLTATPNSSNTFINSIMKMMYPLAERICPAVYKQFIRVTAIRYGLSKPKAVRYKGWGGAYNHVQFEQSLMTKKNKELLISYVHMIDYYVDREYISVREQGQKAVVFCATVNMCMHIVKFFKRKYPHLNTVKYTSEDEMTVFKDADIAVSTVLSAGTAVDIPGLRYNLMTTVVDSQQSNEQTMGRTRPLKDWPHIDPVFHYFVCNDIEKTIKYHENKKDFFTGKVKSHGSEFAPCRV
jgi:superfamily II DNA or RNA helicase